MCINQWEWRGSARAKIYRIRLQICGYKFYHLMDSNICFESLFGKGEGYPSSLSYKHPSPKLGCSMGNVLSKTEERRLPIKFNIKANRLEYVLFFLCLLKISVIKSVSIMKNYRWANVTAGGHFLYHWNSDISKNNEATVSFISDKRILEDH